MGEGLREHNYQSWTRFARGLWYIISAVVLPVLYGTITVVNPDRPSPVLIVFGGLASLALSAMLVQRGRRILRRHEKERILISAEELIWIEPDGREHRLPRSEWKSLEKASGGDRRASDKFILRTNADHAEFSESISDISDLHYDVWRQVETNNGR